MEASKIQYELIEACKEDSQMSFIFREPQHVCVCVCLMFSACVCLWCLLCFFGVGMCYDSFFLCCLFRCVSQGVVCVSVCLAVLCVCMLLLCVCVKLCRCVWCYCACSVLFCVCVGVCVFEAI